MLVYQNRSFHLLQKAIYSGRLGTNLITVQLIWKQLLNTNQSHAETNFEVSMASTSHDGHRSSCVLLSEKSSDDSILIL